MTTKFWIGLLCCLPLASFADEAAQAPAPTPMTANDVCLIQGVPSAEFKYSIISKVVAKKGSYGSVAEMLPGLAGQALGAGGAALINYNGGQHFGFWPWRLTRPIVSGTVIRWEGPTPDCTAAGGATVAKVMASNVQPKVLNPQGAASAASEPAQP